MQNYAILESLNQRDLSKLFGFKVKELMIENNDRVENIQRAEINNDDRYAFIIHTNDYVYFRYHDDDKIHFAPI